MEEPNNDIDTETLQAQIDLSMAYAQNLIVSWLPTSGPMSQSSSRAAEAEVELEALLRRPPRCVHSFPSTDFTRRLFELFTSFIFFASLSGHQVGRWSTHPRNFCICADTSHAEARKALPRNGERDASPNGQ